MLHRNGPPRYQQTISKATVETISAHTAANDGVLFQYVPVIIYGNGKVVETVAFVDSGSSGTFIEEGLIEELNLDGKPHPLCIRWTGDTERTEKDSVQLELKIAGVGNAKKVFTLPKVHTIRKLALPRQSLSAKQITATHHHLRNLPLASYTNASPRLLIGIDNCHLIHRNYHICMRGSDDKRAIDAAMREFFPIESLGIAKTAVPTLFKDDERALQMLTTETRLMKGRYETCLLWRFDNVRLPCSREMALKRYGCLRRKMRTDPALADSVVEKMQSYEDQGYVRRLTSTELTARGERDWYLPVFPVFNPNKPGKLRLVFDAAAKVRGVSLNTFLLAGPDLLAGLLTVLYKFREHRVAIVGDIKEMFFQVRMNPEDQRSQLFFWDREEVADRDPTVYAVAEMTFGAACSPSSAQFVNNLNATRFEREHYVDDMLASVETEDEAITLADEARRGKPIEILSDRGTNFVGAERELKEAWSEVDGDKLVEEFTDHELTWKFNPPGAPHFGGCWERLVQSVKKVLREMKISRLPTDEVLSSTFAEIEMIVNSRPLTQVPLDEKSESPPTPNHFLLGSANTERSLGIFDDNPATLKVAWKTSQVLTTIFWKKWDADYLPTLTKRGKWFETSKPITVGDIVVVVDGNLPKNTWPKGRIVAVKQAKDGQVRQATVQTAQGLLQRPATKLAVLDVKAHGTKAQDTDE
ncbi:uncharacterized protein LOC128310890 [Anopheles moucheti]|uniref:uncharacterized protein LOC128310890 n=1 Tax=Anopheles moucheti TaxID=186751 RepID=UPI0022F07A53|nr:uncharacterized protein LOC128310890 [Anopheles moucheti]